MSTLEFPVAAPFANCLRGNLLNRDNYCFCFPLWQKPHTTKGIDSAKNPSTGLDIADSIEEEILQFLNVVA